jgi:hypothetical protein
MPARNYKKEYQDHQSSEAEKKRRAARNKARRDAVKRGAVKKGDGKEVDHKKPLAKGGSNARSNQRVVSRATNRKKGKK